MFQPFQEDSIQQGNRLFMKTVCDQEKRGLFLCVVSFTTLNPRVPPITARFYCFVRHCRIGKDEFKVSCGSFLGHQVP